MKEVCLRILLGLALIIYGVSSLMPNELQATEEYYPCEAMEGFVVACGDEAEEEGGECKHTVGTTA